MTLPRARNEWKPSPSRDVMSAYHACWKTLLRTFVLQVINPANRRLRTTPRSGPYVMAQAFGEKRCLVDLERRANYDCYIHYFLRL